MRERATGAHREHCDHGSARAQCARAETGPERHGAYIGLPAAGLKWWQRPPESAGGWPLMATLEVRSEKHGKVPVLGLSGELDFAGLELFEAELIPLEQGSPALLILDLSELSFLDSSGLNGILQANRRAAEDGRRLVIVRGDERVQRIFDWTGVTRSLEFVDSPQELPEAD